MFLEFLFVWCFVLALGPFCGRVWGGGMQLDRENTHTHKSTRAASKPINELEFNTFIGDTVIYEPICFNMMPLLLTTMLGLGICVRIQSQRDGQRCTIITCNLNVAWGQYMQRLGIYRFSCLVLVPSPSSYLLLASIEWQIAIIKTLTRSLYTFRFIE